jgi:hypothetical protein
MYAFPEIGGDGWVPMSTILAMSDKEPYMLKAGLWLAKKSGLLEAKKGDKEMEFRLSPLAKGLGISWKTIKIKPKVKQ